jgi:hypothetical protein
LVAHPAARHASNITNDGRRHVVARGKLSPTKVMRRNRRKMRAASKDCSVACHASLSI